MKVVYLMRHAKSSWGDDTLDDFARPLNDRGRGAAPTMGRYMSEHDYQPQLILCSSARRTRQTLDLVLSELPRKPDVRLEDSLYNASSHFLLNHILSVENQLSEIMFVAHNPGIQSLTLFR